MGEITQQNQRMALGLFKAHKWSTNEWQALLLGWAEGRVRGKGGRVSDGFMCHIIVNLTDILPKEIAGNMHDIRNTYTYPEVYISFN